MGAVLGHGSGLQLLRLDGFDFHGFHQFYSEKPKQGAGA